MVVDFMIYDLKVTHTSDLLLIYSVYIQEKSNYMWNKVSL